MKKLIELKQTCCLCPEQWEGKTEDGEEVYARERHGSIRVELDNAIIFSDESNEQIGSALDALLGLFEIPQELLGPTKYCEYD